MITAGFTHRFYRILFFSLTIPPDFTGHIAGLSSGVLFSGPASPPDNSGKKPLKHISSLFFFRYFYTI